MKNIYLTALAMCFSVLTFAQGYNVSVCGTVSNLNGSPEGLSLYYWGSSNGQLSDSTDFNGQYCTTFTVLPDSGGYANLGFAIYLAGCNVGDTLDNLWINADTTITIDMIGCGSTTPNCDVQILQGTTFNGEDELSAVANGVSPYNYVWNDGTTGIAVLPQSPSGNSTTYCVTVTDANNCQATSCYTYTNNNGGGTNCSVNIYYDTTGFAGPQLYANPTGTSPYSYIWSDNSTNSQVLQPVAGDTYCVTVTTADSCVTTDCFTVPNNNGGGNNNCSVVIYEDSSNVLFASGSGTAPFTYVWDDGTVQEYLYVQQSGTYCVTVTDANGCSATTCYTYSTNGSGGNNNCSVQFTSYIDSSNVNGGGIQFTSSSTGTAPYTYYWTFSDGGSSALANPFYAYSQGTGWDWACVEITDANGCSSSFCEYVDIPYYQTTCNAAFWADFDDVNGTPGEVFFQDYSTSGGTIVSWDWDLGDGTTSTQQNPVNTYSIAGYYTVCLTTTDSDGCTSSFCQTCYIDPAWWSNNPWNPNGTACQAEFVVAQDSSLSGMIYLIDISTGANLNYTWSFGANNVVSGQYPFVNFTQFGWHEVCLTVEDSLTGCSSTFCDSVGVDSLGNIMKATNWGISVIPTPMPKSMTEASIEQAVAEAGVELFPNPTRGDVELRIKNYEAGTQVQVSVANAVGQVVQLTNIQKATSRITINQPAGVYFVSLQSEDFKVTKKVIVE